MKLSTVALLVSFVTASGCGLEGLLAEKAPAAAEPVAAATAEPVANEPTTNEPVADGVQPPPDEQPATEVADLRPAPTVDAFVAELTSEMDGPELRVEIELSNVTGTTPETSPVIYAVCRDADQERVALVVAVTPDDQTTRSVTDRVLLRSMPQACAIRIALAPIRVGAPAKIIDERCLAGSELTPGPCSPAFAQPQPPEPVGPASFVVTGAPAWVPYTGTRRPGADVRVDIELGFTHSVAGLGEVQAFVQCDDAPEEELLNQDAPITTVDDLSWVAPGQRVHVVGATTAMLTAKAKACAVRVTAKPTDPSAEPITVVEWCLGTRDAKLGGC